MSYNEGNINVKLRRTDLCDLILAAGILSCANPGVEKWVELHDKLKQQLDEFDNRLGTN